MKYPKIFILISLLLICNCHDQPPKNSVIHEEHAKDITLTVKGMTCPSCKSIIENSLHQVDGVIKAQVSLPTTVYVNYNEDKVSISKIKKTIEDSGYKVE